MKCKVKVKTFQITTKTIPNNIKVHIAMKISMLFICHSWNKCISPFHFDVIYLEQCDFHGTWVILSKTRPEIILICTTRFVVHIIECQTRFDWLHLNTLGYVFQENSWTKLNKHLAKRFVSMCKFTHFHFCTKSCKHNFDIFWGGSSKDM